MLYCTNNIKATYLTWADKPNSAYNAIGLACRLCYQYGLNQTKFNDDDKDEDLVARNWVFWSVFITDCRLALSYGRPPGIDFINIAEPDFKPSVEGYYGVGRSFPARWLLHGISNTQPSSKILLVSCSMKKTCLCDSFVA